MGLAALVLFGTAGCATRGYVREQVGQVRSEMTEMSGGLQAQGDQTAALAGRAMEKADSADLNAAAAHDLALGRVDFREVSRFHVQFAFDSADLDEEAMQILDELAAELLSHPEYVIDLYGFADPSGPEAYNYELGRRRVEAVERYLVEQTPGELSRYKTISFGERIPSTEVSRIGEGSELRQTLVLLLERVPTQRTGPTELAAKG